MESPAGTDDGDEALTVIIHDNGAQNPPKNGIQARSYSQIVDTIIIASNLGILRSVEFGAAKLLLV